MCYEVNSREHDRMDGWIAGDGISICREGTVTKAARDDGRRRSFGAEMTGQG